jgi:pyruvate dehydrogenase E2 component (dihydrolipoamide acetyltransferase)
LLVPVVRDVDKKGLLQLATEMNEIVRKARDKKISPDEMEGGTFTVSNQGSIGGSNFTPLIYWPQVAILGVSRTVTKPRWIDGEWRPRRILPLSVSYDHRIIDGADAARFLVWLVEALQQPMLMQLD